MKNTIKEMITSGLSPNNFLLLRLIWEKDFKLAEEFANTYIKEEDLNYLENFSYIKRLSNSDISLIVLREKSELLFKTTSSPTSRANNLVDSYREIFPKGSNTSGYRYRGDKQGCLKKLVKFIKLNPKFTDEEILQATTNYVNRFKIRNYEGMRLAHYFIEKDNGSDLLGELEGLDEVVSIKPGVNQMI